jgi:Lon protease-like protein
MHPSTPAGGSGTFDNGMIHIPTVIPIFPLPEVVLLPGEVLPLHIFEPRYRAMVSDALRGHRVIGMVETEPPVSTAVTPALHPVGCVGFIAEHRRLRDGRFLLWLLGLERFSIDEELVVDTLYRQARVTYTPIPESRGSLAGLGSVRTELLRTLPELVELDDDDRSALADQIGTITDSQLIALASQILELPSRRKRELLEADNMADRFLLVTEDLYRRLDDSPAAGEIDPAELN